MTVHRYFKTDKFLKSVDIALLRNYFLRYNIELPVNIDFDDNSIDIFWNELKEDIRNFIEEELHCINDTADKARDCLERACKEFNISQHEDDSPETTAMRVFLHSEEAFNLAYDFYLYYQITSEKISRYKFQNVTPNFDNSNLEKFKFDIAQHFKTSGKSDNCYIRFRVDSNKHIFIILRGDYKRTISIFDDSSAKPNPQTFRPAKEDVLVYDIQDNSLVLNISTRNKDEKNKYIEIFSNSILGTSRVDNNIMSNLAVNLLPIKSGNFNYIGNEQIEKIKLSEIKARIGGLLLILKGDELSMKLDSFGLRTDASEYISVKLKFFIRREGKKANKLVLKLIPQKLQEYLKKKRKR